MKIRMLSDGNDGLGAWKEGDVIERPAEHCLRLIQMGDAEAAQKWIPPALPDDG